MTLAFKNMPSPVGELTLVASDTGLTAILWPNDRPGRVKLGEMREAADHPVLAEAERQIVAYFAGTLTRFDVPLDFRGTDFQKSVWAALLTIPFGETRSYAEIARQIGRPSASRAVGAATAATRSRSSRRATAWWDRRGR
jgi:methylated-DNA-[protein]-cysteine S-methyltransferase